MTGKRLWICGAVSFFAALVLLILLLSGAGSSGLPPLEVRFLKVGRADAIVLRCDGKYMVLDVGEEDDGAEVIENLREMGCQTLDLMVITHFDKDHVGGADQVLEAFPVKRVCLPDYPGSGSDYSEFLLALEKSGAAVERLQEKQTLRLGAAALALTPPEDYQLPEGATDYDNELSLTLTLDHGGIRMVFLGDAEKNRLRQWLESDEAAPCDLLKLPHHGIYNAALEEVLDRTMPRCAVACTSKNNPAEEAVLTALDRRGISLLETRQGDIWAVSDGSRLTVRQKR